MKSKTIAIQVPIHRAHQKWQYTMGKLMDKPKDWAEVNTLLDIANSLSMRLMEFKDVELSNRWKPIIDRIRKG